jgi:hypothetical protein
VNLQNAHCKDKNKKKIKESYFMLNNYLPQYDSGGIS